MRSAAGMPDQSAGLCPPPHLDAGQNLPLFRGSDREQHRCPPAGTAAEGPIDEIFFLDLPTIEERREIFTVHLKKRKCIPAEFDLDTLAEERGGHVGAEIEQTIIDAMYHAFSENMRRVTTTDILFCMKTQVPLSSSQRETVATLRAWLAEGRAGPHRGQPRHLRGTGERLRWRPSTPGAREPL